MTIRAVVFDFDGLILDTEGPAYAAWCEVYERHGFQLEQSEWQRTIGTHGGFDPLGDLEMKLGTSIDREALAAIRWARKAELTQLELVRPGIVEWLDEADARGLKTAVASSSATDWVSSNLGRLGLVDRFVGLYCWNGELRPKPEPDLYVAAIEALGVAPDEAIAVEDSPNGVLAAKAAGLWCVAVPNPLTEGLDFESADLIVASLADLTLGDAISAAGTRQSTPTRRSPRRDRSP